MVKNEYNISELYIFYFYKGGGSINNLEFSLRNLITIDNGVYRVVSLVSSIEDKGTKKYNIYRLEEINDYQIKFLYINTKDKTYMLLVEYPFNKFFNEEKLLNDGYNKISGQSMIIESRGAIDYYLLDNINYSLYVKDENIALIQKSKKNSKYLKGKRILREDFALKNHDSEFLKLELENKIIYNNENTQNQKVKKRALIVTPIILLIMLILLVFIGNKENVLISNNISKNIELEHVSTVTSTEAEKEKAEIYESDLKVAQLADLLIEENKNNIVEILKNDKESTVIIITDDEYCIVYTGDQYKTLVQISSREYLYFSDNELYRAAFKDDIEFYKESYYNTCFNKDKELFSGKSPFLNYK